MDHDDEFIVFVNSEAENWSLPDASNFTRVVCPICVASCGRRYCYEQEYLTGLLKAHGVDLVHLLAFVAQLFLPCPSVFDCAR